MEMITPPLTVCEQICFLQQYHQFQLGGQKEGKKKMTKNTENGGE